MSGVTAGGGGQGAECPPDTSHREISADLPGKEKEEKKKEKWRGKEGKLKKESGKLKMEEGKVTK